MASSPRITPAMKRDALASSPFFQPMRAEELDAVVAHSTDRRVPRNTVIFEKGDEGHSMMAVLAGRVRVGSTSSEGKELTHRVIGPGEIFGEIALLDGKPRTAHAVAIEDTTLMVVERRTFLPLLLHHEGMVERLLGVLCDRIRRTTTAIEDIALFDLPVRLARLICKLADESGQPMPGGGVRIAVKLSDRDLANLVASTRESVNKQISAWRKIGAVTRDGGFLVVRDRAGLSRLAE
jgi:CRP/FNR family cyclic AMP-dependent transcriptional regulator